MKLRKIIAGATLAIAFVINPACYETWIEPSPVWQYGEREMRNSVEGTWELTYEATDERVRFTVAQSSHAEMALAPRGGLIATAHACGARSLIRTAGACYDESHMPLDLIATGHQFKQAFLHIIGTVWDDNEDPEMRPRFAFTIDGIEVKAVVDTTGNVGFVSATNPRKHDIKNVSVALRRISR